MNATQPELGFHDTPPGAPAAAWLERWLQEHSGWHQAADILQQLGREATESSKREIRSRAAASDWIISGQQGYAHLSHATAEEVGHFRAAMHSQAAKMEQRQIRIGHNAHTIFG